MCWQFPAPVGSHATQSNLFCLRNLTPLPVHPLELFALSSGPANFWQLYQRTYKQIVAFLEWWHKNDLLIYLIRDT